MAEWQPIETAPKDGFDGPCFTFGSVEGGPVGVHSTDHLAPDPRGGWLVDDVWEAELSHWMPTPAPPEQ